MAKERGQLVAKDFEELNHGLNIKNFSSADPIICQLRDHEELVMTNLSDRTISQQIFQFKEERFIKFVDMPTYQAEKRIGLLTQNKNDGVISFIIMRCRAALKKHYGPEINQWSVQKYKLDTPGYQKILEVENQLQQIV